MTKARTSGTSLCVWRPRPLWRFFPLLEFTPHFGDLRSASIPTWRLRVISHKSVKHKLHPAASKDCIGRVNHCDDAYKMLYK